MKVFNAQTDIASFAQRVSLEKTDLRDWYFLHVIVQSANMNITMNEVRQFLEYYLESPDAALLVIPAADTLLLFAPKDKQLTLNRFEKAVYENFPSDALRARVRGFEGDGLEQFSKIIEAHVRPEDVAGQVALTRMRRPGNCILIVDDDQILLKQLEKILLGIGSVILLSGAEGLPETYARYAPNVILLDIHLGRAKGNEVLKYLKKHIDPYAYVVMISSDTKKEMILDVKNGGANGFVMKPFSRSRMYQEIFKAPTIVKKGHGGFQEFQIEA